jgi:hypothetical protein
MPIERILRRSEELDDAIVQVLDLDAYQPFDDSSRIGLSVTAASLSIDHWHALRLLVVAGHSHPQQRHLFGCSSKRRRGPHGCCSQPARTTSPSPARRSQQMRMRLQESCPWLPR